MRRDASQRRGSRGAPAGGVLCTASAAEAERNTETAEVASMRAAARRQRCERCGLALLPRRRVLPPQAAQLSARATVPPPAPQGALAPPAPPSPAFDASRSAGEQPPPCPAVAALASFEVRPPRSFQAASTTSRRGGSHASDCGAPAAASPPRGRALLETASLPGQEGMWSDAEESAARIAQNAVAAADVAVRVL